MKIKDIKPLNFTDLDRPLFSILSLEHRIIINLIVGCLGNKINYKNLINEVLCNEELKTLEDLIVFFELQNMFEFCFLIEKGIEVKTLQTINRFLNV